MPSLARPRPQEFTQRVEGTWGEFRSRSGRVSYLMTNARLGGDGPDWERRLTSRLRPVREVLEITEMDFDELLQRDLDDHRVATELVPYLLQGGDSGPAFFPPILAVLLPFQGRDASSFPAPDLTPRVDVAGLPYMQETYGDAFRILRLVEETSDEPSEIRFGQLGWNDERAKLVVIDGQHRAMALLAVDRTLHHTWEEDARGARYRHFYQSRVERALAELGGDSIGMVQVPVTVCWFPDLVGSAAPHPAARKLFVDVNREAKPPSTDRVILLSDDDLLNVLTRSMLNNLRARATDPPLYAIEYDSPTTSGRPTRWSAIASLQAVRNMVRRAVFGPQKYIENVAIAMRGRESDADADACMHQQLRLGDLLRHEIGAPESPMLRNELGRYNFPVEELDVLKAEFNSGWGAGLLEILGELLPYKAHYQALHALDEAWQPADPSTVDALAREAVFEGVGMYWTLRDSHDHWRATTPTPDRGSPPDVAQAWERVRAKEEDFRRRRAMTYLGRDDAPAVTDSEGVYGVVTTHACQVGLALLLATLASKAGLLGPAIPELARALTSALNDALTGTTTAGVDRRQVLAPEVEPPFNLIGDMNTPRSVEFRYLWLELLAVDSALDRLITDVPTLDPATILTARDSARARYVHQLVEERITERRRYTRRSRDELRTPTTIEVTASLEAALEHWFDISSTAFRAWSRDALFEITPDDDDDSGEMLEQEG